MNKQSNCTNKKEVAPAAFMNGAKRYVRAADTLLKLRDSMEDSLDPIYMLYFHASELALKAFLAFQGEKTVVLKNRWKHNLEKLLDESVNRGLKPEKLEEQDIENVMQLLHSGNRNEAFRYFTWESTTMPEIEWSGRIVNRLISLVEKRIGFVQNDSGPAVKLNLIFCQPMPK